MIHSFVLTDILYDQPISGPWSLLCERGGKENGYFWLAVSSHVMVHLNLLFAV
ncbi:hypothetical protein [Thermosporothrix hazakensis]|uniref:hypothetical protein n=1 Tax=Thermosporothrix hazakensis TaxID=644383 RepID=UPI001473DEF4|nr:hypothetical protein [Thermosporothrix hazakensis]